MSHRIVYLTMGGSEVIEYTDEKGYARLQDEAAKGIIDITNSRSFGRNENQ